MSSRAAALGWLLLLVASAGYGQSRYISDELIVPLRTGPSIRNAITRNLRAGTAVEVLEQNEEGYARVRVVDRGTEGWLESQYLVAEPVARDRLEAAEGDLASARGRAEQLAGRVAELTTELDRTRQQLAAVRETSGELNEQLQDVREASSDVLAIQAENEQLRRRLREEELEVEALMLQNGQLASRERQNWFVIGAAVLSGGIVMGLVLPSLRRRRRDW